MDLAQSFLERSRHYLAKEYRIKLRAAVEALPAAVIDRFSAVDGVINCAGIIQPFVRLKDLDDAAIERVMAVNWWGTLYLTKAFLPLLLAGRKVTS